MFCLNSGYFCFRISFSFFIFQFGFNWGDNNAQSKQQPRREMEEFSQTEVEHVYASPDECVYEIPVSYSVPLKGILKWVESRLLYAFMSPQSLNSIKFSGFFLLYGSKLPYCFGSFSFYWNFWLAFAEFFISNNQIGAMWAIFDPTVFNSQVRLLQKKIKLR